MTFTPPSFDLGIEDDFDDAMVVEDSHKFEDLSSLIVEDLLDNDTFSNHVEDNVFADEVNSEDNNKVTLKKTEALNEVDDAMIVEDSLKNDEPKYNFEDLVRGKN